MKLCRYDNDRLGIVRGDLVHDVTTAQTEIRNGAPYAMKGDAVLIPLASALQSRECVSVGLYGPPDATCTGYQINGNEAVTTGPPGQRFAGISSAQ